VALFGAFPTDQYHFLFQIRPDSFYHGVEHYNSTVIAIGPGSQLMGEEIYTEVLGVSSHELFHTWNVKAIRPADMQPYRYDGPNYCQLHYVTEGVTTYYGDLMLLKSGVWNLGQYLEVMNAALPGRYYKNDGRKYISLEQASFDSWVNGYRDAVPNRKISFYTKGALVAFIADVRIRQATGNERSLDTVMRLLWERFGKTGKGYTRQDYQNLLEEVSGQSFTQYFQDCISGTTALEPMLAECAQYLGLDYVQGFWPSRAARYCGMLLEFKEGELSVSQLFENGPAEESGLYKEDIVMQINGKMVNAGNFAETMDSAVETKLIQLTVVRDLEVLEIDIPIQEDYYCPWYQFVEMENPTEVQLANRASWASVQ
jgi:predicted metalloprotease with PDZ domain